MKYQITVETLTEREDTKYPDKVEIYQQIVDDLNVPELVTWINTLRLRPPHCSP